MKSEYELRIDNYIEDSTKKFSEHIYFFKYQNLIRNQIIAIKFKEKPYIYRTITYFLKNMQKNFEILEKYDIIIVVPVSKERKKERGYNQCTLFANEISKIAKIPIATNILYKIKDTVSQSSLNKQQREKNVKGVYKAYNTNKLYNKRILIIDDIYTTGNTVNECANILIQNGIKRKDIGVLTIAKD